MNIKITILVLLALSLTIALGQTTANQALTLRIKAQSVVNISQASVSVGAEDADILSITTGSSAVSAPNALSFSASGGTLTYFTNLPNGINVTAKLGGTFPTGVTVKLSYGSASEVTLSTTDVTVLSSATGSDTTGDEIVLSFTAENTVAAGSYNDTITYTLTATPEPTN